MYWLLAVAVAVALDTVAVAVAVDMFKLIHMPFHQLQLLQLLLELVVVPQQATQAPLVKIHISNQLLDQLQV
jgi:hypothetical protein